MKQPLRVLILEDQATDADLVLAELRRAGYQLEWKRVETQEDYLAEIAGDWEIILADYNLPQFTGVQALDLLRGRGLETPFIIVSGTIGEEKAVEAIKAGANDYVMKDRLARLTSAVEREVRAAGERRRQRMAEERNARLAAAVEQAAESILITDTGGTIVYVNPTFERNSGYSRDEAIGQNPRFLKSGKHEAPFYRDMWETLKRGGTWHGRFINKKKNGALYAEESTITPVRDAAGRIVNYVALQLDVTRAVELESQVQEAQQRLASLVTHSPAVIYACAPGGNFEISYMSSNVRAQFGYDAEEFVQDPELWTGGIHPEDRDRVFAEFERGILEGAISVEYRFRHKDGSWRWVKDEARTLRNAAGHPVELAGYWTDITASREAEERLQKAEAMLHQSQKMEAVGRLAGGVAHDFNNLLTAILGFSELAGSRLHAQDPMRKDLEEILNAGRRAADLTRQLLIFSRKQVIQPRVLELNGVVQNMDKLLRRLIGEDIDLTCLLAPSLGRVRADPGQIEQVIMNLAVNARDAMPGGGRITIETANIELGDEDVGGLRNPRTGPCVMLAITDTGSGMTPETQARLFEPFFTTKEIGKGTGLGLATVYSIVQQNEGSLGVTSVVGKGTTFQVYLPRVEAPIDAVPSEAPRAAAPAGRETILVVEDEAQVRRLAVEVLRRSGYTVLDAANGGEALLLCERHQKPIQLLITDVVMPQMSGQEVAKRLLAIRPAMRVLFCSGYTSNVFPEHELAKCGLEFLQKPFSPRALVQKVREVLDKPK